MTSQDHLRERSSVLVDGPSRAAARSQFYSVGFDDEALSKPLVMVAHNWIGTMGHRPIYLAGRLQSVLDAADVEMVSGVGPWMPLAYTVPLAAVYPGSPALPPDMVFVGPEQRADQIRERQVYQQEKYAPW